MTAHGSFERPRFASAKLGKSSHIDGSDINRAREAAEALFAPKPSIEPPALASPGSIDRWSRKPRFLSPLSLEPARVEPNKAQGERDGPSQRIPASHLARIRTLLKYGITAHQAAEMYGVSVSDLDHMLRQA
jgi:hypothetical protein